MSLRCVIRFKQTEHFKKLNYLTGVAVANDSALIQMINIRTQINNQTESKIDIFRCSLDCFWLFSVFPF